MKHLSILFLFVSFGFSGFSQNYPIAVNDTADIRLGEHLTINVTANDYHPGGLAFKVVMAGPVESFTDSTITCFFGYDDYYNFQGDKYISYRLEDENGDFGPESYGEVVINLINHFSDTLDINNISALINPYGSQFWCGPLANSGGLGGFPSFYEYPKGSGKQTIFTSAFWIGGVDQDGQLRLDAELYRQRGLDYWSGPLSVENETLSIDTVIVYKWHRVWKLSKNEIEYHVQNWNKPGYEPIPNIASWPAHGDQTLHQNQYLAPFIDVDGDGFYDPYSGDYPLIRGDQCVFFIFNDLRNMHSETQGNHIGLEIHGMMYQFNQPDNVAINNTTFLNYKIFNRSPYLLTDTYIGMWTDIDLGYADDDYVGCDVSRGMYFGYNGDEIDGNGGPETYGEIPPAQGVVLLGGPLMDVNGLDDPSGGCDESINGVGFGDDVVDNERYGMTSFIYFNNDVSIQGDPYIAQDYYNYLTGVWMDGAHLQYPNSGLDCRFMFPGLTDPCYWGTGGVEPTGLIDWREETGDNGEPNPPADRRGLGSSGSFTFLPHSVQSIDVAYVTAQGDDGPLSSVELLKVYVDSIRAKYFQNTEDFGTQYLGVDQTVDQTQLLKIFPNPVEDRLQVEYASQSPNAVFSIYDLYGRMQMSGKIHSTGQFSINVSNLKSGLYIISVTDDQHRATGSMVKK